MHKYYNLALSLLFFVTIFLTLNTINEDLTGYAIGDNGTIVDTNGTQVSVTVFFPNDYYNSTEENVTFSLNIKNVEVLYYQVNSNGWNIELVNTPSIHVLINLDEGLNTVSFYGCFNVYCSITKEVIVSYIKEETNTSESNMTVEEVVVLEIIPEEVTTQENTAVVESTPLPLSTSEVETPKKGNLSLFIGIGIVLLIVGYIVFENVREKMLSKKENEVKS